MSWLLLMSFNADRRTSIDSKSVTIASATPLMYGNGASPPALLVAFAILISLLSEVEDRDVLGGTGSRIARTRPTRDSAIDMVCW